MKPHGQKHPKPLPSRISSDPLCPHQDRCPGCQIPYLPKSLLPHLLSRHVKREPSVQHQIHILPGINIGQVNVKSRGQESAARVQVAAHPLPQEVMWTVLPVMTTR